ncbi:MAG TPA: nucleoside monophosphate kinase [Candidatus Parcubacteria bacterium]|nr:nucleoside monophosphate kinase [Candidatus Parcubacteria bacterium]
MTKTKNNQKVIVLLGSPGAGKGTQGELLAESLHLFYFETSRILEEIFKGAKKGEAFKIEGKTFKVSHEKKLWETGKLCDPPFVTLLVKKRIKELAKEGKGLVLSGSPRTIYEGERIVPLLKKLYQPKNIKLVLLEISPKETLFRNSHRRICQLMRHPILFSKETENLRHCPLDGSRLLKRKGLDDLETIKTRIEEYKERTYPLIDYFKRERLKVVKVNGSPPPAKVFSQILKKLNF